MIPTLVPGKDMDPRDLRSCHRMYYHTRSCCTQHSSRYPQPATRTDTDHLRHRMTSSNKNIFLLVKKHLIIHFKLPIVSSQLSQHGHVNSTNHTLVLHDVTDNVHDDVDAVPAVVQWNVTTVTK